MSEDESWSKALSCPRCGGAGAAQMRHDYPGGEDSDPVTYIDVCPPGFVAQPDEDEPAIFRFFCVACGVTADQ